MKFLYTILFVLLSTQIVCAQNFVTDFALYNPDYEDDGVWEEEVIALEAMFFNYNWSYKVIDHTDINNGILGAGTNKSFNAIIMPGGWALNREIAITPTGENSIRNFIQTGGNYIGFCAGSFYAANITDWAHIATGNGNEYNLEDDYVEYDYNQDLLDATAKGPFGWTPWEEGTAASLQIAKINTTNPTMNLIGLTDTTRFFYYGGPFFTNFNSTPPNYEVWATTVAPYGTISEAKIGDNQPSIIRYSYGNGTIVLFSYHPEILINSSIDNVKLAEYINEDNTNWELGNQTQVELNLQSWNIVHAALQIANNEFVTKVEYLPVLLSIKIFLQGPYNSSTHMMNSELGSIPNTSPYLNNIRTLESIPPDIVDWVLIELRESATSNAIISKSVLLHKDGRVVRDDGVTNEITLNVPNGNYYIVVKHRNHLAVMSKTLVSLNETNSALYDFTIGSDRYYGVGGLVNLGD